MRYGLLPVLFLLTLSACDSDKDVLPDPTPDPHPNTVLTMAMHWTFGADPFSLDSIYHDDLGHLVRFDEIRFHAGAPVFLGEFGDTLYTFPDNQHLISAEDGVTIRTIGEVDAHLHTMVLTLGLDSAANHTDPSVSPEPLNDFLLWWGWATGRVFLRVVGKVDSNGDGTIDALDNDITYDVGRDQLLRRRELLIEADADVGGNVIVDLGMDVQRLIQGIDMVADPVTHTDDDPVLAQTLMDNLVESITVP